MKIIVGLGNPDKRYEKTLHNLGFMAVQGLAETLGIHIKKRECRALTGKGFVGGGEAVLALPQTYMNLSGESVRELLGRYRAAPGDLLVIYDDMDIEKGALRVRGQGSGGTHNGLKNIVACLGTTAFPRIRIGIGRPPAVQMDCADYVLSEVRKADAEPIFAALKKAAAAAGDWLRGKSIDDLMCSYNGKDGD